MLFRGEDPAIMALVITYNPQQNPFKISQKLEKSLLVSPWFLTEIALERIIPKSLLIPSKLFREQY